jgi:hypothetical protein
LRITATTRLNHSIKAQKWQNRALRALNLSKDAKRRTRRPKKLKEQLSSGRDTSTSRIALKLSRSIRLKTKFLKNRENFTKFPELAGRREKVLELVEKGQRSE